MGPNEDKTFVSGLADIPIGCLRGRRKGKGLKLIRIIYIIHFLKLIKLSLNVVSHLAKSYFEVLETTRTFTGRQDEKIKIIVLTS